jgi:hypothetical protein
MFVRYDLDVLHVIAVRTAPGNSWTHLAERVMPVLNLALQNVALERSRMSPQMESLIKCKNTMHDVRLTAEHFSQLKTEYKEPTEGVIHVTLVNSRFRRMHLKGTLLMTYQGVIECNVDSFFENNIIHRIDSAVEQNALRAKDVKSYEKLQKFIKAHCTTTQYAF